MTKPNGWTGGEWMLFHSDDGHAWIADKNLNNVCWVRVEDHARLVAAATSLYEALSELSRAYVNLIEHGRDQIVCRGGQCDPVDVMEARDPYLAKARAALSAVEGGV